MQEGGVNFFVKTTWKWKNYVLPKILSRGGGDVQYKDITNKKRRGKWQQMWTNN